MLEITVQFFGDSPTILTFYLDCDQVFTETIVLESVCKSHIQERVCITLSDILYLEGTVFFTDISSKSGPILEAFFYPGVIGVIDKFIFIIFIDFWVFFSPYFPKNLDGVLTFCRGVGELALYSNIR